MNHRRGISLIELIVVISGVSVVLGVSVGLLHRVMRTQSNTRHFFDRERAAMRLSGQFRKDIHAASEVFVSDNSTEGKPLIHLTLHDGWAVDYFTSTTAIVRTSSKEGIPSAREEFVFDREVDAVVHQDLEAHAVVLSISDLVSSVALQGISKPLDERNKPIALSVYAIKGRDLRMRTAESPR